MESKIGREQALALLKEYNKEPFHILHALTVEAVMRSFAKNLGYAEEEEYWGITGLLHDIDFEMYPSEHCKKAPELLKKDGRIVIGCTHSEMEQIKELAKQSGKNTSRFIVDTILKK